jgi:hypothetical protein
MNNIVNPIPDAVNAEDTDNLRHLRLWGLWDTRDSLSFNLLKIPFIILLLPLMIAYFLMMKFY